MQCNLNDTAQTCTDLNNRSASNLRYWLHATGGAGDPTLAMWSKREEPVLPMPPPDMPLVGWRDPFIFEIKGKQGNGQEWGMLMGSGLKGQGGAIMIYRSESLYGGTLALCLNLLQSTCILQLNVSFSVPSCFAGCAHEYALKHVCMHVLQDLQSCPLAVLGTEAPFTMSSIKFFVLPCKTCSLWVSWLSDSSCYPNYSLFMATTLAEQLSPMLKSLQCSAYTVCSTLLPP